LEPIRERIPTTLCSILQLSKKHPWEMIESVICKDIYMLGQEQLNTYDSVLVGLKGKEQ
jgi:hypothetical protein